MAARSVFYTANAGFFLTVGDITLAVDAFPRRADRGFSALSEEDFQMLCSPRPECRAIPALAAPLPDPRYVITTHDHPDHYSASRTAEFLAQNPTARFIGAVKEERLPEIPSCDTVSYAGTTASGTTPSDTTASTEMSTPILLNGERHTYYFPGITLEFLRLPHEGQTFARVPNYGCIATFTGPDPCRALFLGDARPADPTIAEWLNGRRIDLALLNFPWIALPKGRYFIEKHLADTKIGILHLPYEPDDRNGYLRAAKLAVEKWGRENVNVFREFGGKWEF